MGDSYAVTKRRKGKAPEGFGVPVGTGYHWYIMAHQNVRKLDANSYTTSMTGLKYKLAHKRADHDKWNTTAKTQRKRLIKVLQDLIKQLEKEPAEQPPLEAPATRIKSKTATTIAKKPVASKAVASKTTRTKKT